VVYILPVAVRLAILLDEYDVGFLFVVDVYTTD